MTKNKTDREWFSLYLYQTPESSIKPLDEMNVCTESKMKLKLINSIKLS